MNDLGFSLVDLNKVSYENKYFIIEYQEGKYFMSMIHVMRSDNGLRRKNHV